MLEKDELDTRVDLTVPLERIEWIFTSFHEQTWKSLGETAERPQPSLTDLFPASGIHRKD
jgi:hypothetical protein